MSQKSWKSHGNLLVKMCTNPGVHIYDKFILYKSCAWKIAYAYYIYIYIYIYIYKLFLNETQELNWVCLIRETFKILQGVLQDRFGNHWPNKRLSTRIKFVTAHRKSIDYE